MRLSPPLHLVLFLSLWIGPLARAQDIPEKAEERLSLFSRSVENYTLAADGPPERKFEFQSKPLLRFDNPVGGVVDGVLMLWTDGGRPAALGQVFVIKSNIWLHEFQSISTVPFVLDRPELGPAWKPRKAGVEFRELSKAPSPATSRGARLTQMKSLARRFAASEDFRVRLGDADTTRYELRLLPSPAYRHPDQPDLPDGALFAFVHGTDPEVVLLLEASGQTWKYALAPVTCWGLQVSCDGEKVWSVPERVENRTEDDPYFLWTFKPSAADEK